MPSTFTVEGTTALTTACGMLVVDGGGPRSGARSNTSENTRPNCSSPISRRRLSTVSGGSGKRSSTQAASVEPRAWAANHPGTSAIRGRRIQMATITPTRPAPAPAARSTDRTLDPGRVACNRVPMNRPRA